MNTPDHAVAAFASKGQTMISAFRHILRLPKLAVFCAVFLSVFSLPVFSQSTAAGSTLSSVPFLPGATGTYYYEGFDTANDRYVFISTGGTYFYVDSGSNTVIGGAVASPGVASPYRAVIVSGSNTFQFSNAHPDLYTPVGITGSDFTIRSGTWFADNVAFILGTTASTAINNAAIALVGYTGTTRHPVVFSGTNLVISTTVAVTGTTGQAVSIDSGASFFLYGGTISKTFGVASAGSETIYMKANGEGEGSKALFHVEDVTIISSGQAIEAINQDSGSTRTELYRSTISSTINGGNANTNVIRLSDPQKQGGAQFYAEDSTISVSNTGAFQVRAFAFFWGENNITLKNSTLTTSGVKVSVFRWVTSEGTGGSAGGNENLADGFISSVTLENTNIATTGDYSPIFQQTGRLGRAVVTGGTLTTTGNDSPIIRLVGANDAHDETKFTGIFTNVAIEARNSSAVDLDIRVRDSANYGEDGGGVGKEVTTLITTAWDLLFQSSTLTGTSSFRIATAGAHNSPYSNETKVTVRDSTINGRIEMLVDGGSTAAAMQETTGANLFLQGFNSVFTGGFYMTGTEIARKYHQAKINLTDSSFDGDIIAVNRGEITLNFVNTQLTGNLSLSGSTRTYINLSSSPISGMISLGGTARLENNPGLDLNNQPAIVRNSPIGGGFNLAGSSFVDLTLSGSETIVSGGITATDNATAVLRFVDDSSINGGVTLSGTASVSLVLSEVGQLVGDLVVHDRARLALYTSNGGPVYLDRGLILGGIWAIPGKTTLEGSLDITNDLGTIQIINAAQDSLILKSGLTGKGRLDIQSIDGAAFKAHEIHVIKDESGNFAEDALILAHPVDYGLAAYSLENRSDGAYLVGGIGAGSFSSGGAAVFNSQALAAEDWFASLSAIGRRMSALRMSNTQALSDGLARSQGDAGALWLEIRGDTTRVSIPGSSLNFDSRTIGFTAGVDARWDLDTGTVSSGIFADAARTDRDFDSFADGSTDSVGGGLYIHYQHRGGFFASAIGRFDTYEITLSSNNPTNAMTADYNTQTAGFAFEFGWRFDLGNGWSFEPSYQLALASLPGVSYTTQSSRPENVIPITIADGRATQNLFRFAVSKALNEKWTVRGHLAAANVNASGGEFTAKPYIPDKADFTIDGDRIEASIGISRRIGHAGRITLDAAYTEADAYERPCTISLGFSYLW